jgi:hypothetical protein
MKEIVILAKHPENHSGLKALLESLFPECRVKFVTESDASKDELEGESAAMIETRCTR